MQELIALAKAKPGELNYGSFGNGTYPHVAMEDFKLRTGTQMLHIPYKGATPAITALLRSEVAVLIVNMSSVDAYVKAGTLRIIAAAGARKRSRRVRTCRPLRSQAYRVFRPADGRGYSGRPICPSRCSTRSGPIQKAPSARRKRVLCSRPTRSNWFARRPSNSCNSSATTSAIGRGRSRPRAFSLIERVSPMVLFRLSKIAMIAALAAFAFIVAYDNIVDYDSNYEFVRHVLSMDTTFPNNALMGRAITDKRIWTIAYSAIIAVEALTCLLLSAGALALLTRLKAPAEPNLPTRRSSVAGLTVGFGLLVLRLPGGCGRILPLAISDPERAGGPHSASSW